MAKRYFTLVVMIAALAVAGSAQVGGPWGPSSGCSAAEGQSGCPLVFVSGGDFPVISPVTDFAVDYGTGSSVVDGGDSSPGGGLFNSTAGALAGGGFTHTGGAPAGGGGGVWSWVKNLYTNAFRQQVEAWAQNYNHSDSVMSLTAVGESWSPSPPSLMIGLVTPEGLGGEGPRVVLEPFSDPAYGADFFKGNPFKSWTIKLNGYNIGGVDSYIEGDTAHLEEFRVDDLFQEEGYGGKAYKQWEEQLPSSVKQIELNPDRRLNKLTGVVRDARPYWLSKGYKDIAPSANGARRMLKVLR